MTDSEFQEVMDWAENKYESAECEMQMWDKVFNALDRKNDEEGFRKPKKVVYTFSNVNLEKRIYGCPTCERCIQCKTWNYCPSCGQALDWEVEK